ncbi:hypothetical protein EJ73_02899, partial [Hoylesella shahii DSM 15611 = JCM 12083]
MTIGAFMSMFLQYLEGINKVNRGYRYIYDDLNRLVNAEYGENNFSTGIGRYNEGLGYDGNSNVTSLQR